MELLSTLFGNDGSTDPHEALRLARIERKLDLILAHLGIAYEEPAASAAASPQVQDLLRRGNKIGAIKAYREETGTGLAEAKAAVEALERELRR